MDLRCVFFPLGSTRTSQLIAALALCLGLSHGPAIAQSQRALLIGIDTYTAEAQRKTALADSVSDDERGSVRGWTDLDGAVNDAQALRALLTTRFGFAEENVRLLLNADATRKGILQALRDLIDASGPGDTVVFMYAGHGSQVTNTASTEPDGQDESIVPADSRLGALDIRDKELRVLFNELLTKGVQLTIIFDSCHSGSVTRGVTPGKARNLKPSSRVISDDSPLPPPPQENPAALVISAAQDNEVAKEAKDSDGTPHGAFTWALTAVLRTADPATPARDMFARVRARMKGHGFAQEPVLAGQSARLSRPLFGGASRGGAGTSTRVAVIERTERTITLQGGLALGLRPDCELCALGEGPMARPDTSLCVTVTETQGLARARAVVTRGEPSDLGPGDLLAVTRWVASPGTPLRIWIPPALEANQVRAAAGAVAEVSHEVGMTLVEEPTVTPPTHVVQWTGSAWVMTDNQEVDTDLGGPTLHKDAIRSALSETDGEGRLFIHLPPTPELAEAMETDLESENNIETSKDGTAAHYVLTGGIYRGGLQYGWLYAPATESGIVPAMPPTVRPVAAGNPSAASAQLVEYARQLNRVWGWMQLESPPDEGTFPYRLTGFEDVDTGAFISVDDTLRWGHRYRAVIEADSAAIEAIREDYATRAKRYMYLFAIDRNGNSFLLYGGENVENDINLLDDTPDPIRFTIPSTGGYLFTSEDADGDGRADVDTFFFLTTEEPITAPRSVLAYRGVPREVRRNADPPLTRLLLRTGSGMRGFSQPVPTNWAMIRAPMTSAD